jgi:glycosyltransferase involved in cell wall biosynthesis
VIEAVGRLAGRNPVPGLVIAGAGNDPAYATRLRDQAARSPIADRIRFVGHVDREVMRALYQRAELVILATEVEACPNIAIEAMTAGAAILASDCPPLPEIIGPGNAEFFPARDIGRLADLIRQHLDSPGAVAGLRARSRERAAAWSWEECARQTAELLGQVHVHG